MWEWSTGGRVIVKRADEARAIRRGWLKTITHQESQIALRDAGRRLGREPLAGHRQ